MALGRVLTVQRRIYRPIALEFDVRDCGGSAGSSGKTHTLRRQKAYKKYPKGDLWAARPHYAPAFYTKFLIVSLCMTITSPTSQTTSPF